MPESIHVINRGLFVSERLKMFQRKIKIVAQNLKGRLEWAMKPEEILECLRPCTQFILWEKMRLVVSSSRPIKDKNVSVARA